MWAYIKKAINSDLNISLDQKMNKYVKKNSQTFTSSGTFTVPANVNIIDVFLVGGGGNGGDGGLNINGGGGGGGFGRFVEDLKVTPSSSVSVVVAGAGGDSYITVGDFRLIGIAGQNGDDAVGDDADGGDGGCGGGASSSLGGLSQYNDGSGRDGGNSDGKIGGSGLLQSSYNDNLKTSYTLIDPYTLTSYGNGGNGGGVSATRGQAGDANTGNGGNGNRGTGTIGGAGGTGIVIIYY